MKLNGLLAVALMVGSMAAVGCKSRQADDSAVAPEENPDTAPVVTATAAAQPAEKSGSHAGTEVDSLGIRGYISPMAPPALKVEVMGAAPSPHHFWAPGYWRWNGHEHSWYGGRWLARREGYNYYGPRWENRYNRWHYYPGYWHRHY